MPDLHQRGARREHRRRHMVPRHDVYYVARLVAAERGDACQRPRKPQRALGL